VLPFEEYVCCLNSEERSVLRALALAYVAGLGEPVTPELWQTFWGLTFRSRAARQSAFVVIFPLQWDETSPIDGSPVGSVLAFTSTSFWLGAIAFFLTPEGACLEGCKKAPMP